MHSHCFALIWLLMVRERVYSGQHGDSLWQEKTSWGIIILATVVGDPWLFTGKGKFFWHLVLGRCSFQTLLVWEAGHQYVIDCWWMMSKRSAAANCFHASERKRKRERPWWTLFNISPVIGSVLAAGDRFLYLLLECSHNYLCQLCNLDGDTLMPVFIFITALIQLLCGLA